MSTVPPFVALVPMKAHSVRIPLKNVRVIGGRPLYHYIMEALLACPLIERVVIDTDHEAIADEAPARFPRTQIIWRPEELRGDFVSMNRIIEYDLGQIGCDWFLQTHSTNPLVATDTITRALEKFWISRDSCDSLFSVTRLRQRLYDSAGCPLNHDPAKLRRTQDLPPVFAENSNMYVFSRATFIRHGRRVGEHPLLFETPALESVDVDAPEDLLLVELLLQSRGQCLA